MALEPKITYRTLKGKSSANIYIIYNLLCIYIGMILQPTRQFRVSGFFLFDPSCYNGRKQIIGPF
jgi:hypothetical protein